MNLLIAAVVAFALVSFATPSAADKAKQIAQAQQAAPGAGGAAADLAAAQSLLDSWKGEIEVLEQARHKLEAAWKVDPKNPAASKVFEQYQVVRKQMYEIQRKTRGGPAVAEVRKVLDSWDGKSNALVRAQELLDKLLVDDPYNAYAPIEAARLEMLRGYINNRTAMNGKFAYSVGNYAPDTFGRALTKLMNFRRFDPLAADAFVMQAFIYFQQTQLDTAEKLLTQAEAQGATDPRRHFNWADVHVARGKYPAAIERIQRALREEEGDKIAMIRAHSRLASIYDLTGEAEKAVASHKTLLKLEPQSAWLHSNYARFLCDSLGRYDEALAEIRTALQIMDFGVGQLNLADALYGKWSVLVAQGDPKADDYFDQARRIKPDLDAVMAYGAALPTGERLAKALITKSVSIDARALDGSTALLIATNRGRTKTVKFLLGLNANPNIGDQNGWTPLLSAASDGNTEIVNLLLAKGADTRATLNGKDAPTLADQNGYPELAAALRKRMSSLR